MGSNWNEATGSVNVTSWDRSWRQEIFTDLGTDFQIKFHMEKVSLESGEVLHNSLPTVQRSMSQVYQDPDVIALGEIMTRLAKKWMDEDIAAATPPTPVPPVEPAP